jgi:hypothetical protein
LGESCALDTQCPLGSRCLAVLASDFCTWQDYRCATPCSFSAGYEGYEPTGTACQPAEVCQRGAWDHLCEQRPADPSCVNLDFGGPSACVARESCNGDDACTGSEVCRASGNPAGCSWPFVPPDSVGRACGDSSECSPGLECVEGANGATCQIRCQTADMTCPAGSTCLSPDQGGAWVCAFGT